MEMNVTPWLELQSPPLPLEGVAAPVVREDGTGPIAAQIENWRACAIHPWVLPTMNGGYRLQFAVLNGVLLSAAQGVSARVLEEEISCRTMIGVWTPALRKKHIN